MPGIRGRGRGRSADHPLHRCVVKVGKALLDCWGFAGSAQLSVGVIAHLQVRTGFPRKDRARTIM